MVIETSPRGERAFDIYSLLLRERIIFPGHAHHGPGGEHHNRPTALPGTGGPGPGHQRVHQQSRGLHYRRPGHIRHHADDFAGGFHRVRGYCRQHGHGAAVGRRQGQALLSAQLHRTHAPGPERNPGSRLRTSRLRRGKLPASRTCCGASSATIPGSPWRTLFATATGTTT